VKDGMQSARVIDWTDRGIFYDQQTTTWDLFTVPMDPVERRQTGPPRLIPYPRTGRNVSPAWSPDGGRFAFVSSSAAEPNRRYVVVMPADGGQAREFLIPTTTYEYPQSPPDLRWFGDGRGLGFSGRDNRGAPAVFRLRLETGEWDTTPLSGARMLRIEWNRDGSAFYFSRESTGNPGIFERSVTSDVERLVYRTKPRSMIRSLEFSPDRKWLAFQERSLSEANQSVNSWYLILDVERGEARTLLEDVMSLANTGAPHLLGWTPSGDLIVHKQSRIGAPAETLLVPVNGSAPRAVAIPRLAPTGPREQEPDVIAKWSSTGRWMVLGRVSRGAETFVIENPVAAVRATVASR
jgi:Tol biopolymer transport system component